MCENVFPCFWSSCAGPGWWHGGEKGYSNLLHLKFPDKKCLCSSEWSPLFVARNPNITHRLRGVLIRVSRPQPVSSFFSRTVPILLYVMVLLTRQKRLTEIWEMLMQPFHAPCRHQWGLQSTLDDPLGVVWRGVVPPSATWDRIWTIILSSSILPLMTW